MAMGRFSGVHEIRKSTEELCPNLCVESHCGTVVFWLLVIQFSISSSISAFQEVYLRLFSMVGKAGLGQGGWLWSSSLIWDLRMQSGGGIIPDSELEIRGYSWMQWCTCRLSKHYVILSWWERRCVRKGKRWAEVLANPKTISFPTISCWISGNKNTLW